MQKMSPKILLPLHGGIKILKNKQTQLFHVQTLEQKVNHFSESHPQHTDDKFEYKPQLSRPATKPTKPRFLAQDDEDYDDDDYDDYDYDHGDVDENEEYEDQDDMGEQDEGNQRTLDEELAEKSVEVEEEWLEDKQKVILTPTTIGEYSTEQVETLQDCESQFEQ